MPEQLPTDLHERITELSALGNRLAEIGDFKEALSKFNEAWKIVPEPKNEWEASTWLLAAIGDMCFLMGYFKSAIDAFRFSLFCPGGSDNPFLSLRLGQCEFEKNNMDEAAEYLTRAYMLEGLKIFERQDSKYLTFLKTRIKPPTSGEW